MDTNNFLLLTILILLLCNDILLLWFLVQPVYVCLQFSHSIVYITFFELSTFLRRSLIIFIIKGFRTIVFIFIVIFTMIPAFFWCLSNSGTYTEPRTSAFIESTGVACSDSVSHNRVQVLSIPVLLLACSQDWTFNLRMIVGYRCWFLKLLRRHSLLWKWKDLLFRINSILSVIIFYWILDVVLYIYIYIYIRYSSIQ